jgi:hypothetical protein
MVAHADLTKPKAATNSQDDVTTSRRSPSTLPDAHAESKREGRAVVFPLYFSVKAAASRRTPKPSFMECGSSLQLSPWVRPVAINIEILPMLGES